MMEKGSDLKGILNHIASDNIVAEGPQEHINSCTIHLTRGGFIQVRSEGDKIAMLKKTKRIETVTPVTDMDTLTRELGKLKDWEIDKIVTKGEENEH